MLAKPRVGPLQVVFRLNMLVVVFSLEVLTNAVALLSSSPSIAWPGPYVMFAVLLGFTLE